MKHTLNEIRGGGEKHLTLLIPMYNKAPYIDRMVRSISEQTYLSRTKIIVWDDGSTDSSLEELEKALELYNVPMEIFHNEKNLGLARTILNLYRKIDTPFWAVLDPDDYYIAKDRIERAVRFLKKHPDHSSHACNYLESHPDGRSDLCFSKSQANVSIDTFQDMPSPQTSAMVYRNFWTQEIFDEMQRLIGDKRYSFMQADAYRNFCAIHFGKFYFENFVGSVWSKGIGIWDRMTQVEQHSINSKNYSRLFEFSKKFFHNMSTEVTCLKFSVVFYYRTLDEFHSMMKDLKPAQEFRASEYFMNIVDADCNDISAVANVLLDQLKFFEVNGVNVN